MKKLMIDFKVHIGGALTFYVVNFLIYIHMTYCVFLASLSGDSDFKLLLGFKSESFSRMIYVISYVYMPSFCPVGCTL